MFLIKTIDFIFDLCYNVSMNKSLREFTNIRNGYIVRKNYSDAIKMQNVRTVAAKDLADNFANPNLAMIPIDYQGFLRDGDLVMKARGNVLTAKVFHGSSNEKYIATSTLLVIGLKDNQIMPEFLELILNSKMAQRELQSKLAGSLVPTLSPVALGSLEIPILSQEDQERAVRSLKVFKDMREKVTSYNNLLEKIEIAVNDKIMEEIYE